jgi:alkylation response protein AidB-like acyl-CoA dehydrogenase
MSESDDTRELRRTVRSFLEQHAPARAQLADDAGLWKRLTAELGLTGLAVSEEHGGSGASYAELAVVLEEAGRTLLRAPLLSTAVAAVVAERAGAHDLLPGLVDGTTPAAFLDGDAPALNAHDSALLMVLSGDDLLVVETAAASVTPLESLDPTRPLASVVLDGTSSRRIGEAAPARDLLHVALAAESVGGARRILELSVQHLLVREQFGRPLGSFQALRHRVADLTVELEAATSTVWYAARAAAAASDELPVVAPLAKAAATDAFTHIAGEAIQLHGGIGFTWEHDAHLYFKRAWTTALLHGDSRTLRRTAFARAGC